MFSVTFTIPFPVLVAPQYFKYRYRLSGGAYGAYSTTTSQTITISSLAEGSYELEVIFVNEDGIECPATLIPFEVVEPFECIDDFAAEIVTTGNGIYTLRITYTPGDNPPCGWTIQYSNIYTGGTKTVQYSTLPVSGVINITLPGNANTGLTIFGEMCNNELVICFEDVITGAEPTCIPMTIVSSELIPGVGIGNYVIRLNITNSNPATNPIFVNFTETTPGSFPINQTFTFPGGVAGGTALYSIPVTAQNPDSTCIRVYGEITDQCQDIHLFCVTYPMGCIDCP